MNILVITGYFSNICRVNSRLTLVLYNIFGQGSGLILVSRVPFMKSVISWCTFLSANCINDGDTLVQFQPGRFSLILANINFLRSFFLINIRGLSSIFLILYIKYGRRSIPGIKKSQVPLFRSYDYQLSYINCDPRREKRGSRVARRGSRALTGLFNLVVKYVHYY